MMKLIYTARINRIIAVLVCGALLTGCAGETADSEDDIELVEPVGNVVNYCSAEYRELSKVSTYQGVVCPTATEYTYDSEQTFGRYGYLPGEAVSAGDILFYADSEDLSDSVEEIEDTNVELLSDYSDYVSDYSIDLAKAKKNEFEAAYAYQQVLGYAPDEDSPYYTGWARSAMPLEANMKNAKMTREKLEQAYKEKTEMFELEYAYNETRIERIKENMSKAGVVSDSDGIVVSMNGYLPGDNVPRGTSILAVGDPYDKEIKCEYISKSNVNKALDIYAIIGGKRYEVVYEVMEPEEYRRLQKRDDDVYTSFKIVDPADEVQMGAYAVIVAVESQIKDALCIPKDAINKDDGGTYVYLYDNNDTIYTTVTPGETDGSFTQILGGLSAGDKVVYDTPYTPGNKTMSISKGEVHVNFSAEGYLMYPGSEWMVNPAVSGTCYINELCVERFEQITEGQTLAKVEVVTDAIEIERISRKISRENERIADLNNKRKETANEDTLEAIDRAVRDRNRTIEALNKQLEKLSRYSGIVEIKAPYDGIVTELSSLKDGQIIGKKEKLVQIAGNDSCYIIVEDKNGVLSYGDKAVVSGGGAGDDVSAEGYVVSLNPYGLSKAMRTGYALIKVSQEDMSLMTDLGSDYRGGYWARIRFDVRTEARSMEDVLLIPKNVVYRNGNDTFVIVPKDDGTYGLVKFTAGGSDNSNYWVAYGDITEGMVICSS